MAAFAKLRAVLRGPLRHWEGRIPQSQQAVRIEDAALRHIRRFRQQGRSAKEAGGQLFGLVTDEWVIVSKAVGPSASDERGPFSFRSDPNVAQKAIQRLHKRGLLYLGEWHTHAELIALPSPSDLHAMQQLMKRSHLNTRALLLVILGLGHPDTDVGAWYVDENNFLRAIVGSGVRV